MDTAHKAAEVMRHHAEHDAHGYTQGYPDRWGTGEETIIIDGEPVTIKGSDRDCSSGIVSAYEALGVDCGGATYTGDMRRCMTSTGNFRWHPMSDGYIARPGDIYLNEASHTAMCISDVPDLLAEFSINEFGGIVGGQPGDQTGRECLIRPYYDFPWDGILECLLRGDDDMPSAQEIAEAIWSFPINGVQARDRLIGIDTAANRARELLESTDDPTGRGVSVPAYQQPKWNGKAINELNAKVGEVLEHLG